MARTESTDRTFVKKLPDGTKLTRPVTSPASEVEAVFDGFTEQTGAKASGSAASSNTSSTTRASSSTS